MALFIDTFVNRIDKKGRISVPASFRAALAGQVFQGIAAFPTFKYPAIQCGGLDWMAGLLSSLGNEEIFSDAHDDITAAVFSDTKQLAFDGEGRIMLPEVLLRHAGITDVAAFVGRGPTFDIWEPSRFEIYKAEARKRALEKGRTLRQSPTGETGGK